MNVHPQLTSHPKFLVFKRELGAPEALEYLLRIWGHCQTAKRGENWGRVGADYLEAIAGWTGEPDKLWKALLREFCGKPGWIHLGKGKALIITGWEEHNTSLVNTWRNGSKGGRPPSQPTENPRVTRKQPTENPRVTHGEPVENPTGLDLTGLDVTGREGVPDARAPEGAGETQLPSLAEVRAFCAVAGVPEKIGQAFHTHYSTVALPPWTDGTGKRFQWRGKLKKWAEDERAKQSGGVKNTAAAAEADLESDLMSGDPNKRRAARAARAATVQT